MDGIYEAGVYLDGAVVALPLAGAGALVVRDLITAGSAFTLVLAKSVGLELEILG